MRMKCPRSSQTAWKFFLVFIFAVVAIWPIGCRQTYGSFDDPDAAPANVLSLRGNVLIPGNPASIVAKASWPNAGPAVRAAGQSGFTPVANALVWIEELPEVPAQMTDASGTYAFSGLPSGQYRIVAKFVRSGTCFKTRSDPVEPQSSVASQTDIPLLLSLAAKIVTGVLRDSSGAVYPPGTVLTLWGEKFTVQEEGRFTSPELPNDVDAADIVVFQTGVTQNAQPKVTVQFFSTEGPTTVEVQVGGSGTPYKPIGGTMLVTKNGKPVSADNMISTGDLVDLSLSLTNIDRSFPGITFDWDAGRGHFSTAPGSADSAVWAAPSTSGMATVSVKIGAPDRGFIKLLLPLVVDVPVQAPTFIVTFDSQGGSQVAPQTVDQGAKASTPVAPSRAGFTFAGWFRDANGTTAWEFATDTVSQNTTLYAKWISVTTPTCTVSFNSQGGSAVDSRIAEQGAKITAPTDPTRANFAFAGWYKESAGATAWNFETETVTASMTLYAKWAADQYTLSYTAGANGSITGSATQTVSHGATGTPVTAVPVAGYKFTQWSDGNTSNPRTDAGVASNIIATASFGAIQAVILGENKTAWSENAGWININPTHASLTAQLGTTGSLTGFAWSENIGWVKFSGDSYGVRFQL